MTLRSFVVAIVAMPILIAAQTIGKRPYELDWAGRMEDDHPHLVDFENLVGWTTDVESAVATFERSQEQQIWGQFVGKLTYRADGKQPTVAIRPPEPIPVVGAFDAVTCWVYGNTLGKDATTPGVRIAAQFILPPGDTIGVPLTTVRWKEWFLCHRRLTEEQISAVQNGASFSGFVISGGRNKKDRVLYFDSLSVFVETFPPLAFEPRPKRGVDMFPGQGIGTNTGPRKLPFPTHAETILPDNLTADFKTAVRRSGNTFTFTYRGTDGSLTYTLAPKTGNLSDVRAEWNGCGAPFQPCAGGGVRLMSENGKPIPPDSATLVSTNLADGVVTCTWRLSAEGQNATVTYAFRLWQKSLVVDIVSLGGAIHEVHFGETVGTDSPRLVTLPYYTSGTTTRPAILVTGPPANPLFISGHVDWTRSNAATPFAVNSINGNSAVFNGGTRYIPKTDGRRNDCFERFIITVSPRFEEILPNIPNPVSPWKHVTGTRVWRAHGASNRERDTAFWTRCHRYGITEVVVTDHETGWRDGEESFTFRTRPAPGKGGDEGQFTYARHMQDTLGFVYGPYNNYTDFAPVNEFWHPDMVNRRPENQLQTAWRRCYAPKPARAVEYCARLAPIIEEKFDFSTAYCDVHTAVTPWSRTDYDPRVPGAGTFSAVFYSYGEIMLHQKRAWDGPVYSEGNNHWLYCGLTDGNYAQDQRYRIPDKPWLVDFDLRKMHDLCCNFGMGNLQMFFGREYSLGSNRLEQSASIDRFLAATVGFGHTGFLIFAGGYRNTMRSYYMLQQLHSRYALASAVDIRYATDDGRLLPTTEAVATDAFRRSQLVTRYSDGTITAVNGHRQERMRINIDNRVLNLPPNGYAGWTSDGQVHVLSADVDGHRCDYAVTPAYIYIDGRGTFIRYPKAAGAGQAVCRILPDDQYEIIPFEKAQCGFAITAVSAEALDEARNSLGPAEVRQARGLTYVMPVEGAFSYVLKKGTPATTARLACERTAVVPGETATVTAGAAQHSLQISPDAAAGDHVWRRVDDAWIDFAVVPLADTTMDLAGSNLRIGFISNLPQAAKAQAEINGKTHTFTLSPDSQATIDVKVRRPSGESLNPVTCTLQAGDLMLSAHRLLLAHEGFAKARELPSEWSTGMRYRGAEESSDFGESRAHARNTRTPCGDDTRDALFMHPPYMNGVGYTFALYNPVTLPQTPPSAFRAAVGKKDGSDPGDGILYKLAIIAADGGETILAEQHVGTHTWLPIEGDLTPWAGQTIRIKLITDVGAGDDSSGDWGCWADMRIETLAKQVLLQLVEADGPNQIEPGPTPVSGLSPHDLRQATGGRLRYDGIGLTGTGSQYETYAIVNDVEIGPMAPANGSEREGVWVEKVAVELTPEAITTLGRRNTFRLRNPGQDWFKVRRFWIELDLPDGRTCSSNVSSSAFTQPPNWPYAEGVGVPHSQQITVQIWFPE
ncbi:MAG: hypothetical protein HN742_04555 [Lentisphaerae bacterium]|jgi:hypothetical protein|nr:hypothetical protein [Lentisphaerota bacterium]MBT4821447.1 hypothetical protein [Lentisphaerota bacterium]MBT5607813.1 hypothetical protein [Lentisphaerota bacterium]MBT7057844.1 hypothetical protein [Lentisphaerota bacterium]MBT7841116.1 hypothetical protein [Lentisphaerota bacterium]